MARKQIVVVDYGMGNLRSVAKAAEHVAGQTANILVSQNPQDIVNADAIIFPGQGAAKACMEALHDTAMLEPIIQAAQSKPFLGICMGLQVLMTYSDENHGVACLDVIPGLVKRFDEARYPELKIPHMGWNQVQQTHDHPLWHGIANSSRFYFVHSYFVKPKLDHYVSGTTDYGDTFCSAIAHNNLFAIQAHPEKSADAGLQLFKNFINWNGA